MTPDKVNIAINGKKVRARKGDTVLEAARDAGIDIPTLCYHEALLPTGSCRLCVVEIGKSPKPFASCVTPVSNGMEVTTDSPRLKEYRRMAIQNLLSERTHICSVCVANGSCELQKLADELGVDHVVFEREWPRMKVDSTHSFLVIDRNRCVLCTRCIRVCDEIEGVHTLDLMERGKESQVIIDLNLEWKDSTSCTSCRKCAKVCPVGAIYVEGEALSFTKDDQVARFIMERREAAREE